ncbi:MAG: aspartate carbamoyltransferase regulatory subunit [Rikenellaceae bacterium]
MKTYLEVSAIENGTVIDHIPADALFKVMRILSLENIKNRITFGTNLPSRRIGTKAIIKVSDMCLDKDNLDKIAIFAPNARVSRIENFEVVEKQTISVPDSFTGNIKCANPMCITNKEKIDTKFTVVNKVDITLRCHYCEKITTANTFEIISSVR